MDISSSLIGKAADFVGAFCDEVGKQFGEDQNQETAEIIARIAAAAAKKLLKLDTPLVAGASVANADLEEAVDEAIDAARHLS